MVREAAVLPRAEQFPHDADIGVRGIAMSREGAFEQAAIALMGIITDAASIRAQVKVDIECEAPDDGLLLVDWLNALIYRVSADRILFGRFSVHLDGHRLHAEVWGEPLNLERHAPSVEPKGATYTALKVECGPDGVWTAQCVVDV